ncbi:MAG: hypothetical protein AB7E81_20540 [Hyphomicrobiaceae bacterium]
MSKFNGTTAAAITVTGALVIITITGTIAEAVGAARGGANARRVGAGVVRASIVACGGIAADRQRSV